jgi:hypothetical protein
MIVPWRFFHDRPMAFFPWASHGVFSMGAPWCFSHGRSLGISGVWAAKALQTEQHNHLFT